MYVAESEGFEPPDGFPSTVFKTAAFDHSASSPLSTLVVPPVAAQITLQQAGVINMLLKRTFPPPSQARLAMILNHRDHCQPPKTGLTHT